LHWYPLQVAQEQPAWALQVDMLVKLSQSAGVPMQRGPVQEQPQSIHSTSWLWLGQGRGTPMHDELQLQPHM
jgi:hypothetical protein